MSSLRSWSNVGSQLYSLISIEIGWDPVCDCLDGSLSTCILVLSANPWERLTLSFLFTIATVFLSRENTIITMIMFDFGDTLIPQPLFKTCLTHDRFDGTSLMLCHYIYGAALKTAVLWFPSIPSWQTSGRLTDELVCRDKITMYWSLVIAPSRSSSGWVRETFGEHFFARANRHD